jgi:parvulin-like peptidyl-prolyl isomerase
MKKSLTEAEAKRKIEDLRKKLDSGADFAQLAKENSDDKESAEKGGEFPPLKQNSAYPEAIKKAVFELKPGQISQPLRQPNGFYLIRLDELRTQPYEEVRVQIYEEMKRKEFNEWMQGLQKRYEVKVENPDFFKIPTGIPVPPKPPPAR